MTDTMQCLLVRGHGRPSDDLFCIETSRPRPKRGKDQLLLRVMACSLAPGDVRTMSGKTKFVQMPKSGFPYIPGGDVVGIVEEADPKCPEKFRVGDCVVARFHGTPSGGLAQFYAAKTSLCAVKPANISIVEAAAIPASVVVAMRVVEKWVRKNDRVLVLGATGGVGSHVVQLLKPQAGASFVAATARTVEWLEEVGRAPGAACGLIDRVIDYTAEDWWDIRDFQSPGGNKFDLILDFAAFENGWRNCGLVLKSRADGGRYITTTGDSATFSVLGVGDICSLVRKMVCRSLCTSGLCYCTRRTRPYYEWFVGGLADPIEPGIWAKVFQAMGGDKPILKVVVDPRGPFPFSVEGVREAFALQESRHARGKVVITVGEEQATA
eukprot:CAMPEP_0168426978 /NCGR_PEP_ID=MMETSP0228-20121227/36111_1 /TAXON_ID=133427 /ORGANISM="Protoceratium reticulatum, Strain CCCM 535 (=CCMP 1889)" /LENGTH=380 /DNA_ID=CAMNT_0008441005 /DNA_START=31 /DNA_END=1173 /DNA_ORIENTATION=+